MRGGFHILGLRFYWPGLGMYIDYQTDLFCQPLVNYLCGYLFKPAKGIEPSSQEYRVPGQPSSPAKIIIVNISIDMWGIAIDRFTV